MTSDRKGKREWRSEAKREKKWWNSTKGSQKHLALCLLFLALRSRCAEGKNPQTSGTLRFNVANLNAISFLFFAAWLCTPLVYNIKKLVFWILSKLSFYSPCKISDSNFLILPKACLSPFLTCNFVWYMPSLYLFKLLIAVFFVSLSIFMSSFMTAMSIKTFLWNNAKSWI